MAAAPKPKKQTYSAAQLLAALAKRHSDDVFVPECKDGPTHAGNHLRLDAWAMKKSWSSPCAWGYEIKVSRSDFLKDEKWNGYLPYCNQFYFVAPKGLIDPAELADDVGLMVAIGKGDGMRLLTVKKAKYRNLEIPDTFYQYILMCRVVVQRAQFGPQTREERAELWKRAIESDEVFRELGWRVSRAIRDHVDSVNRENKRLLDRMAQYDQLKQILERNRIDPNSSWGMEEKLLAQLTATRNVLDQPTIQALTYARNALDNALRQAAKLEEKGTEIAA